MKKTEKIIHQQTYTKEILMGILQSEDKWFQIESKMKWEDIMNNRKGKYMGKSK